MKIVQIKIFMALIFAFFISILLVRFIFISKSPKPTINFLKSEKTIELILPPYIEKPDEAFMQTINK